MKLKKLLSAAVAAFLAVQPIAGCRDLSFADTNTMLTSYEKTVYAEEFSYELYDDHAEITGCNDKAETVFIPAEIDGLPVTVIGSNVFNNSLALKEINVEAENKNYASVDGVLFNKKKDTILRCPVAYEKEEYVIPEGVTRVEPYSFWKCSKIKNIKFPVTTPDIGKMAFSGTAWLDPQNSTTTTTTTTTTTSKTTTSATTAKPWYSIDDESGFGYTVKDDQVKIVWIDPSLSKAEIPEKLRDCLLQR